MAKLAGLQPLLGAQALASGPQAHVWLSASAGTGKTHVLTARVFRLLLGGAAPESILCLTFTKAGASEMAARVHERLAAWVQMDDVTLALDLKALGEEFGPEALDDARRLFARVLDATGGGLRIQTIHSFCQQLLSAFPMEAGLIPGFRALEEREQQELAREALAELVLEAEASGDAALLNALGDMALRMGEEASVSYLARCAAAHPVLAGLPDDVRGWLFGQLELPTGDVEQVIALACSDEAFDMRALARLIFANAAWKTKTGHEQALALQQWQASSSEERAKNLPLLRKILLTDKGTVRVPKKAQLDAEPDYEELAARLGGRCAELIALRTLAAYADFAASALRAGRSFAAAYAQAKRRAGAVDYDDLIVSAADLLDAPGTADWIRFKLDQQIDHILVDEAQDTNDRQWQIVSALTAEYFAGEGSKGDAVRTFFTVGDFKQAIYGFQGTSPLAFAQARERFRADALSAGQDFHDLSLDLSFRSTPAVLEVVDAAIAQLGSSAFGLEDGAVFHESNVPHPGRVALWKPIAAPGSADEAADAPEGEEDFLLEQDRLLAEKIAAQIAQWIAEGTLLASKGRPMHAGDVMILVRSRGELARLIIARLYEAGVPVAGIDRIRLQAPLAVMDLMAALRFAAQPDDDLNLANLLVSPLIGWSQEQLLQAAVPRKGSLWRHLRATVDARELALLSALLAQADFTTPYQFLERLLSGPAQGRRKLLARLGEEARDPIDELCQAALQFEQESSPSLQPFIDWFDRDQGDIKRESASGGDAVRLLTVHGAKGLQAPVVILADATYDPHQRRGQSRFDWEQGGAKVPLAPPRASERAGRVEDAQARQSATDLEEHWRLMYVAMTRAEERLVLTGTLGSRAKGQIPTDSWFSAAERAMQALGATWFDDPRWRSIIEWSGREDFPAKRAKKPEPLAEVAREIVPWLHMPAPVEARPPRPLAPTAQADDDTPQPPPGPAMRAAAERGRCLHALFERLPAVAPGERREAAERWLERSAGIADHDVRAALIDHALAIIEAPRFADLFAPEALAEAPIAAVVGEDVVAGTVDRLVVGADMVRIVDFKTGRAVPGSPDAIPVPHLRQMAAYVAALEVIFPGRAVEAALLYTSGPEMLVLPAEMLVPHKPGFVPAQ